MQGCRPLEQREIEQALTALNGSRTRRRDRCLLLMGIYSGFRISELLSMRVWDVVQYGKVLTRVRVARKHMKGSRKSREVALNVKARKALAEWLPTLFRWRGNLPDTFVFQSMKGGAITRQHAARIMRGLAARFSWPPQIGTHSLRKTFAKGVYEQACKHWRPGRELPIRVAQKSLGHRSSEVTERYIGLDEAAVDSVVLALDFGGGA
ncbi:MAG: hypothetical protein AUJ49_04930 [Desulfovibrionaceae bacterium CG1_02_65_16]|nr:MAG: hypothetical protein AUJ49_04930 [Desulfovibrionaceae bacterium CG1_02_65_16]